MYSASPLVSPVFSLCKRSEGSPSFYLYRAHKPASYRCIFDCKSSKKKKKKELHSQKLSWLHFMDQLSSQNMNVHAKLVQSSDSSNKVYLQQDGHSPKQH